jgi:hypothetical protein
VLRISTRNVVVAARSSIVASTPTRSIRSVGEALCPRS